MQQLIVILAGVSLTAQAVQVFMKRMKQMKRLESSRLFYEKLESGELEIVYKDMLGNNWYAFKNPLAMPAKRSISTELTMRQAQMCMDENTMAGYLNDITEAVISSQPNKILEAVQRIKERVSLAAEEATLKALANCYFLIEGEDPRYTTFKYTDMKMKSWDEDAECAAFFLTAAYHSINNTGRLSSLDLMNYLMVRRLKSA